jgi:hypothetical protein
MSNKDDEARGLAHKHYQIEDGITQIFRVTQSADLEADPNAPVILPKNAFLRTQSRGPFLADSAPRRKVP